MPSSIQQINNIVNKAATRPPLPLPLTPLSTSIVLTGVDGVPERLPKYSRVRAVLDNDPFEVNDLEETLVKFDVGVDVNDDKFNVGVNVNNDDTVEGVNAARAAVQERFNFLSPVPDELSSD
jgi:hypothetical protein